MHQSANFAIIDEKLAQIMPDPNYDVVIYVVEDNISEDFSV